MLFFSIGIQRTFTEFELPVGFDFQGTEVVETTEVCGKAIPLLLNVGDQQADLASGLLRNCLEAGRTRVVEAVIAMVVGLGRAAVGWRMIPALAPTPIDEVLNPLPRIDQKNQEGESSDGPERSNEQAQMNWPSRKRLISALCGSSHRHQGAQGPSRQSASL